MAKKKKYNLFIDAQNVGSKSISQIIDFCRTLGYDQETAKLYASTSEIVSLMEQGDTFLEDYDINPVGVRCKPRKNSVDIRIAVDIIESAMDDEDGDVIIIATNDSDFTHVASRVISYENEFILIHTTRDKPIGYSPKVIFHSIYEEKPKATLKNSLIKKVTQKATAFVKKENVEQRYDGEFGSTSQQYQNDIPILELDSSNFATRITRCSPYYISTSCLFGAYREKVGKRWKSQASKKTAQEFSNEIFGDGRYVYRQWRESDANNGILCAPATLEYELFDPRNSAVISIYGSDKDLVAMQSKHIAEAMLRASPVTIAALAQEVSAKAPMPKYATTALATALLVARRKTSSPQLEINEITDTSAEEIEKSFYELISDLVKSGNVGKKIKKAA